MLVNPITLSFGEPHKPASRAGSTTRGLAHLPPGLAAFPSSAHFIWRTPLLTSRSHSTCSADTLVWSRAALAQMLMLLLGFRGQFASQKNLLVLGKNVKTTKARLHKLQSAAMFPNIINQFLLFLTTTLPLDARSSLVPLSVICLKWAFRHQLNF